MSTVKLSLGVFLALTLIFPLGALFVNLAGADLGALIASPRFQEALGNSLLAASAGTLIAMTTAFIFALCVVRSAAPFRGAFAVIAALPMLIPSISHGMGLVLLLGANGIFTRLLGLPRPIYGFPGVLSGSVLYAFPVAFLMFTEILKYEDGSPYEAAAVLGIPRFHRWRAITLPYLRKPLISVAFAVFTLIFTDYGVPLMIGGRFITLPVLMYQEVIGLLNFTRGSGIGVFLLLPAAAAFVFDTLCRERGGQGFVVQERTLEKNKLRDAAAFGWCCLITVLIILPLGVFGFLSFTTGYPQNRSFSLATIERTLKMGVARYLANSLLIALGVSLLGTALAYTLAYGTARTRGRSSQFLHLVSITSLAVPGLVLGLSYALFFKGSWLSGTFALLILVNTVHFMASPYLLAYNTLGKLNPHLEDVGLTLGVGRWYIIRDVLIPQTRGTILEMASYFFVNSMMTISAVSFLHTVGNKPLSLMITQFEAQLFLEAAAFVSLLILGCNLLVKCLIPIIKGGPGGPGKGARDGIVSEPV